MKLDKNSENEKIPAIKCFLCGHFIQVKEDKNENPYCYCRYCSLRFFVSERGVGFFEDKIVFKLRREVIA